MQFSPLAFMREQAFSAKSRTTVQPGRDRTRRCRSPQRDVRSHLEGRRGTASWVHQPISDDIQLTPFAAKVSFASGDAKNLMKLSAVSRCEAFVMSTAVHAR